MKALAIASETRSSLQPDVPTLREAGFAEISMRAWFGILAPKGTPANVLNKISQDVAQVMANPEFDATQVTGKGFGRVAGSPEAFAKMIADDFAQKGKVIKEAGIKVDQ